jgi:hypothetical protein
MLVHLSNGFATQRVLVTGHVVVPGGHLIVNERHLRLASAAHARPREAGQYLLFDAARPIQNAEELQANLGNIFQTS